jgi:hypothetical protein
MRAGLAIATLAAALAGTTLSAVAVDDTHPRLGAVTTVTTSTSAAATVYLDTPATMTLSKAFGPSIHGNGRAIGVFLEQKGHTVLGLFLSRDCGTPGCKGSFAFGSFWGPNKKHPMLPGLYHLYVVADGAPVTAVIYLDGPTGNATVPVIPYSGVSVSSFASMLPSTGPTGPGLYSGAASGSIGPNGGLLLSGIWLDAASYVVAYFDSCISPGGAPPAYVAGCDYPPGTTTIEGLQYPFLTCDPRFFCDPGFTVDAAATGMGIAGFVQDEIGPGYGGTWTQGGYFDGVAVLTSELGNGVWVSYLPPEPAVQPAAATPAASPSASPSPTPTAAPATIGLPNTASATGIPLAALLLPVAAGVARRLVRRRR